MVGGYSDKELKAFAVRFNPFETRKRLNLEIPPRLEEVSPEKINGLMACAKDNPKLYVWAGAHNVLVSLLDMYGYSEHQQWEKARVVFSEDNED
jgi:hypothetical protein